MILQIWLGVLFLALLVYLRRVYSRFSRFGVKYLTPVPILGNVLKFHVGDELEKLYNAFPNERFVGRFELTRPVVAIRDLDLIKQVTVKDFEYFPNHRNFVDETVDPVFARILLSLNDQKWKDMRLHLSPIFTSSKIRAMKPFIKDVSKQMIQMLKKKIEKSESGYIDIDCVDLSTRFTNDVIMSCAFGVKVDSYIETSNEFYLQGKSISHFNFGRMLALLWYSSFPSFMKILNFRVLNKKACDFFRDLFSYSMIERETKNIFRPDMIHFLLEAKQENLLHEQNVQIQDTGFDTLEDTYYVDKRPVRRCGAWS